MAETLGESLNLGSAKAATAARGPCPATSEKFVEFREIIKMAGTLGESANPPHGPLGPKSPLRAGPSRKAAPGEGLKRLAETLGESLNLGSAKAATAARGPCPATSEKFAEFREIIKMAETLGESSNSIFNELADWEHQLQALDPEGLEFLEDNSYEEPSP